MTPSRGGQFSQLNAIPAEGVHKSNMPQELSGVTVVIIIASGVLLFILLFIFAKRQIMRFALRSRRGPHVPIGHDAKKVKINHVPSRNGKSFVLVSETRNRAANRSDTEDSVRTEIIKQDRSEVYRLSWPANSRSLLQIKGCGWR